MKSLTSSSKKSTLSDKISDFLTIKPRADIEDDVVFSTKPQTVSREDISSESEAEAVISDFRKRNINLLSEISKKYEGKVTSPTGDLDQSSSSEDEYSYDDNAHKHTQNTSEGNDSFTEKNDRQIISENSVEEEESDDGSVDGDNTDEMTDDQDDDEDDYDISQVKQPMEETFEHLKKQNISDVIKKGSCVRNQLLIWEALLEMRIHLQRCINTANQMPMPQTYQKLLQTKMFENECSSVKSNVSNLLDRFLTLQNAFLKNNPETKSLCSKKQSGEKANDKQAVSDEEILSDPDNEEILSDTDAEETDERQNNSDVQKVEGRKLNRKKRKLEEYENEIATSHKAFKTFRDTTIQKWNDKTRITTAAHIKNSSTNSILQQISYILSDRNKLIKRTQLKRSEYDIIGYNSQVSEPKEIETNGLSTSKDRKENDEYITEIFDDSDFYHQLLRELIECKSADISDPVQLSRQWIALQQMRSKMKRKVDTKATKGRKIKYVVHNQLVNYMAPEKSVSWTDESRNELYSSLFGKMFESKFDVKDN